jgi:hypothetical protein
LVGRFRAGRRFLNRTGIEGRALNAEEQVGCEESGFTCSLISSPLNPEKIGETALNCREAKPPKSFRLFYFTRPVVRLIRQKGKKSFPSGGGVY